MVSHFSFSGRGLVFYFFFALDFGFDVARGRCFPRRHAMRLYFCGSHRPSRGSWLRLGSRLALLLRLFRLFLFFHLFGQFLDAGKLPQNLGVVLGLARPAQELQLEEIFHYFVEFRAALHSESLELRGHTRQRLANRFPFAEVGLNFAHGFPVVGFGQNVGQ